MVSPACGKRPCSVLRLLGHELDESASLEARKCVGIDVATFVAPVEHDGLDRLLGRTAAATGGRDRAGLTWLDGASRSTGHPPHRIVRQS